MPGVNFTPALKTEYENLFNTCIIKSSREFEIETIIEKIVQNRSRYQKVADSTSVPWYFIAVIHNMEAGLSFRYHLHNGDPLTARTIQVPAGRPKKGIPPFTWEDSATDAISMRGLGSKIDWSLGGLLFQLEGYNGWGYRIYHPYVLSPYLWSYSNNYTSGKYVADGRWSDTAVSQQCGAAVLLRRMAEQKTIEFHDQPVPTEPIIVRYSMTRPTDPSMAQNVENLQQWLNTHPGIFVKVDGIPGKMTSEAFYKVTGAYLPDDPRQ